MKAKKALVVFLVFLSLGFLILLFPIPVYYTTPAFVSPPTIEDFYINNTWANQPTLFSFNLSDSVSLNDATFYNNASGTNNTVTLNGTRAWANFTQILPNESGTVKFQLWVTNSNASLSSTTGLRIMKIYTYNSTAEAWNTPYNSLSDLLWAVEAANNWENVEPYAKAILGHTSLSVLSTMLDNYALESDWPNTLKWSAICNKLNITRQEAIISALGNYTMVGNLPWCGDYSGTPVFNVENGYALYGYYYANQSWARGLVNMTKWNITSAFQFFNNSVYNGAGRFYDGSPILHIYANGSVGQPIPPRFYDETASLIRDYILWEKLLNVSGAMNDALHWWNWANNYLWSVPGNHYNYRYEGSWMNSSKDGIYECAAAFFLKIISMLKYYTPTLGNWTNVLTDVGKRFLSNKWDSFQWVDGDVTLEGITTYSVVHAYGPGEYLYLNNPQRRLQNTLGAWQALLGIYSQLNSTYQNNMKTMLYGDPDNDVEPAWALLLRPHNASLESNKGTGPGLYDNVTCMFSESSNDLLYSFVINENATAYAEITLFLMGIVPQNTTIAFPLEEIDYEYINDIDPTLLQLNISPHAIEIPVSGNGTMLFQYGVSPVSYTFNQAGVWTLTFSDSWNNIISASHQFSGVK